MFISASDKEKIINLDHVRHFSPGVEDNETLAFMSEGQFFVLQIPFDDMPGFLKKINMYVEV